MKLKKYPFEHIDEWYSLSGPERSILIINWEVGELVELFKKEIEKLSIEKKEEKLKNINSHREEISKKLLNLSSCLKMLRTK